MNKIEIIDGNDGFEREVTGTYNLDGNNVYPWELYTYDGFTSIHFIDCEASFNLEDKDDCLEIGIEDGMEIYDEILSFVNDEGYDCIGDEFE